MSFLACSQGMSGLSVSLNGCVEFTRVFEILDVYLRKSLPGVLGWGKRGKTGFRGAANKRRRATRLHRASNVPGVRCDHPEPTGLHAKLAGDHAIGLRRRLVLTYGVDREITLEVRLQIRVLHLCVHNSGRRIG